MVLRDVLTLLGCSPIVILQQKNNPDFLFVERLEDGDEAAASDTLYFAALSTLHSDKLLALRAQTHHLSVMLLCDSEVPADILTLFDNVFCFYAADDFNDAFHQIRGSFDQALRFNSRLQEFMELIATEDNLDHIAQWLCGFFGHPVNIVDNNFTYLGYSDPSGFAEFGSQDLMKDIENRFVAPDHIQYIQQTQGINLFRDASFQPSLVFSPEQGFHQYHTPIPIGETIAGAFSVYLPLDEELSPLTCLYLKKIARLISVVLQRIDFYSTNKANFYTTFFSAMLDAHPERSQHWELRLQAYGFQLLPSMHVIAASFPETVKKRSELQNLATTLHHLVSGSIYCIRDDMILLLCCNQLNEFSVSGLIDSGKDFFARSHIKLGVSSEFHSIYALAAYCQEARAAIALGMHYAPDIFFYLYDDFRLQDMICRLTSDSDLSVFCYPPFMELFYYDQEKGTQLCNTLYGYLSDLKNPLDVCRKLNIHKNTLYFRLDKIRSIMKVDYIKLPVASQIFMTMNILRYLKTVRPSTDDLIDFPLAYSLLNGNTAP